MRSSRPSSCPPRRRLRFGVGAALVAALALALPVLPASAAPPPTVTHVAGGGVGDGGPANKACLRFPQGVATDAAGNLYVADSAFTSRIRRVDAATQKITTVPGGTAASLSAPAPAGLAVDGAGNVYAAYPSANVVVKLAAGTGVVTTVAGSGSGTFGGDGGLATAAGVPAPLGVAVDGSGNLFVTDGTSRVRRVDAVTGVITTYAGTGVAGYDLDGVAATTARLNRPAGLRLDAAGNLYVADTDNSRVRKIDTAGTITTFAGNGAATGPAAGASNIDPTLVPLNTPTDVAVDASGRVFIACRGNRWVRRVDTNGKSWVDAGSGGSYNPYFDLEGNPGSMDTVRWIAVDGAGNLYTCADGYTPANGRVFRWNAARSSRVTYAGTGGWSYAGEGDLATNGAFFQPMDAEADAAGNLFVPADAPMPLAAGSIRRVDAVTGLVSRVAGTAGAAPFTTGYSPATNVLLGNPPDLALDASGRVVVAGGAVVLRLDLAANAFTPIAGTGVSGFAGDGGPATSARLNDVTSVAYDAAGNLYLADRSNGRVRRVDAVTGVITTVAGNGALFSSAGDGGPATAASVHPWKVAVGPDGSIFVADRQNHRVRKVSPAGTISTVAGNGATGNVPTEGAPATSVSLDPQGVAVDAAGHLFVADNRFRTDDAVVRRIDAVTQAITTVAGGGPVAVPAFGDGLAPTSVRLRNLAGLSLAPDGALLVPEGVYDATVRRVTGLAASPLEVLGTATYTAECEPGVAGATVNLLFEVVGVPPSGATLRIRDLTGNRTLLSQPASVGVFGVTATFGLGGSAVEAAVLDGGGNVLAATTSSVEVSDTHPPTLSGCVDKTIECVGPTTELRPELLGVSASDACDPNPTLSLAPAAVSGLGTFSVTATARDNAGNTATATFSVTVVDTVAPVFTVRPSDIDADCTDAAGALVAFDVAAVDACGPVTIECEDETGRSVDPAGTTFSVGDHVVTCTATDEAGNVARHTFFVRVHDHEAPIVVCPADITVPTAAGDCVAAVTFSATVTDVCDASPTVVYEVDGVPIASGDTFPLGTTEVTVLATDASGNEGRCSFRILVRDLEAPVISAPASLTLVTDCAGSPLAVSPATLGATVLDNCDPSPLLSVSPASLSPGTTTVTLTASDADGNTATRSVIVTVLEGAFTVRFRSPLDAYVDNTIKAGQTVPVKVDVLCDATPATGVSVTLDRVVQLDAAGTPIGNVVTADSGLSNDDGTAFRATDGFHTFNLSTKTWPTASGARFRVDVRVRATGHVDTVVSVVLRNR